jgi:proline dehydrogenase
VGFKEAVVFRIAKRWISGKDLESGIRGAQEAKAKGFAVILNYLGEDVTDLAQAQREFDEYLSIQRAIHEAGIDGAASVKLTQFGLMVDEGLALERGRQVTVNAESLGQLLWLDMEGSEFTSKAIEIYLALLERHKNVGIALQAYMRRSEADLSALLDRGGRVRLVKGAYREGREVVYPNGDEVRKNYSRLMHVLFERGDNFTIATHDSVLIEEAKRLSDSHHVKFEFAMLRGIRDELKSELVRSGYRVVEYIPYGDQWYAYSIRRMKEHPSNVWLLLRSFL